jgi:predicted MFS family arabinose efflux permease
MWLTLLPACAFGLLDVLAPLRLDHLGASGLALGATFFVAAGVEAVVSPLVGRFTDRRGAVPVVRGALAASGAAIVVLQLPGSAPALAAAVVVAAGVLGVLWVPALQLLTGGADRIGLEHGFAFAFFNLAWAAGFTIGSGAGGALADATTDAVPYLLLAAAYAVSAAWATMALRPGWRRPPSVPLSP